MDKTKIELSAVNAVNGYIIQCPKLGPFIQTNDKTPIWDGEIHIHSSKDHKVENFLARVPLQIKGTTNTDDNFYRIDREYLEAYRGDGGCVFFMVQEDKDTYKPQRILYALLSLDDVNTMLQRNTQTIKIDLKVVPTDPLEFEEELIKFANERRREPIEKPAPKEIAALVNRFKDIEPHLNEVEDKGVKIELKSFLDSIKGLKNDRTVGWRDTFVYLSRKVLDLTLQHVKGYDALNLQVELANYLHRQKLYHLVEDYYLQALEAYRERAKAFPFYEDQVAATLNNLAVLHKNLNQYPAAEKEYNEALDIYRKLANDNSDAYLPDVAMTLNNLAALHYNLNHFEAAEDEYKEALEIRRELAIVNPGAFLPNAANTLNNLAVLHDDLNQYPAAEKEYDEALDIYRKLANDNPKAYLSDVAMTLNNLGNLHSDINQFSAAEKEYKEALDIYWKLAKDNPNAYLPYVATTLNNLAVLHRNLNQYPAAEKEYNEALEIRRKLAKDNPDAYLPNVANTLNNLAGVYWKTNKLDSAVSMLKETLETYRKLAKDNPDAYLGDVAMTLFNMALLMMKDGQRKEEAKQACQESLDLYSAMAQKAPQRFNKDVDDAKHLLDLLNLLDRINKL